MIATEIYCGFAAVWLLEGAGLSDWRRTGADKTATTKPPTTVTVTVTELQSSTLFSELFSEESCSVIGLSEKMGFQL